MTRLIGLDAACKDAAGEGGHRVVAYTYLPERGLFYWVGGCGARGFSVTRPTLAAFCDTLCHQPECFPLLPGSEVAA